MTSDEHRHLEELCAYAEGLLPDEQDAEVEQHLRACTECAALADGFARFLVEFESDAEEPGLDTAVARLDARMAPFLAPIATPAQPRAASLLRRLFGIAELVPLASERLLELAGLNPRWGLAAGSSALARAAGSSVPVEVVLEPAVAVAANGTQTLTRVHLAALPPWPSEAIDLLLEFELRHCGWTATISYLLDAPDAEQPCALLLHEGPVDEEGLLEIRGLWNGPAPRSFEASRLRVCLTE